MITRIIENVCTSGVGSVNAIFKLCSPLNVLNREVTKTDFTGHSLMAQRSATRRLAIPRIKQYFL